MAEVRILGTGTVKDYESAVDVFNRVSKVAAAVDGVVVWETFADRDTGFFVLNENFPSEEAFLEFKDAMTAKGLPSAVAEAIEFEQSIILSPIENERVNQTFDGWGAIRVTPVAST